MSIATRVGQTVCRPWRSYHSARSGSSTRAITVGTSEALLGDLGDDDVRVVAVGRGDEDVGALDPGGDQRLDLEPGADRELAAEVLPALSSPTSSRACDSGSSSRQETSCPSRSIARATDEPTRPQPTIRMNMARILGPGLERAIRGASSGRVAAVSSTRHGAFFITYSVSGPISAGFGGADPAEDAAAPDPGRRLAADHDRLAPRRRASSMIAAPTCGRGLTSVSTSTSSYSSPTSGPAPAPARASSSRSCGQLRVERQGQRQLDHVDDVEPRAALALSSSAAARRPAVATMSSSSLVPKTGTRMLRYSTSGACLVSACSGTETRLVSGSPRRPCGRRRRR